MNQQPKLAVSGYRGIWGTTLTEEIAREYVRAFATFVCKHKNATEKPVMLLGRDGRKSGPELVEIVSDELIKLGFDVINLGMMPTPSMLFLVRDQKANAAIIVTASHNPIEYNGLKFVKNTGMFITEGDVVEINGYKKSPETSGVKNLGSRTDNLNLFEKHLERIISNIDIESIKDANLKVVADTINSVGCTTTPKLLKALGVDGTIINGEPTGDFTHEPEPLPKNLTGLAESVKSNHANIGFAQDPDADRLVICDENGILPSEETMLALCIKAILSKNPGDIVVNLSTSRMSEDIATSFGQKTFRSKVGESNVSEGIAFHKAVVGGEGGGGIIYPTINTARDSFVGIALILELMAKEQKPISQILSELPKYVMTKEKFIWNGDLGVLYKKVQSILPESSASMIDGLRLDFADLSWVHIRPSNTEPIIRIMAEAKTKDRADELVLRVKNCL